MRNPDDVKRRRPQVKLNRCKRCNRKCKRDSEYGSEEYCDTCYQNIVRSNDEQQCEHYCECCHGYYYDHDCEHEQNINNGIKSKNSDDFDVNKPICIRCKEGHIFYDTPKNIMAGAWCPSCP